MPAGSGEVPWATIAVNLLEHFSRHTHVHNSSDRYTLFLGTGLLGGFTTMSTFGVETVNLLRNESTMVASVYIALNLLAPITAWLGWQVSEAFLT